MTRPGKKAKKQSPEQCYIYYYQNSKICSGLDAYYLTAYKAPRSLPNEICQKRKVACKVSVTAHLFYQVISYFVASRDLYVPSFVTQCTLSLFALGITWPLCFLRIKDIRYSTLHPLSTCRNKHNYLKICLYYNIISSSLSNLS